MGIRFDKSKKVTIFLFCNECGKPLYNEEVRGYVALAREVILYCMECYEKVEKFEIKIPLKR